MKKLLNKQILLICVLLSIQGILWGDTISVNEHSPFSFSVMPGITIPLGTYSDIFKTGGGLILSLTYDMPSLPYFLGFSGIYDYIPLGNDLNISLFSLCVFGGVVFHITPTINVAPYMGGGYFHSILNTDSQYSGGHPYGETGIECTFSFNKAISIGINAGYRHFFGFNDNLSFSIRGSVSIPKKQKSALDSSILYFDEIFPVLFEYYNDNPIGSISIRNNSRNPITIITISLLIENYMEESWITTLNSEVKDKESLDVELYAHFTRNILDIENEQHEKATVRVEYLSGNKKENKELSKPVYIHSRNIIKKEKHEQVSAFVTRNDPDLNKFSEPLKKIIFEYTKADINPNIFIAIGAYNAVKVYGIELIDQSVSDMMYESIQLPGTTLTKKQGDSKDVAVLFSSLFESLNVDTAIIHTPENYFIAFSLNSDPESIKENYTNLDNLITINNSTWIPLAFTTGENNFFQAVKEGAESWKEYDKDNMTILYPIHDLQKIYKGLDMSGNKSESSIEPPDEKELQKLYKEDIAEYFLQDSTPKPRLPEAAKDSELTDTRFMNNLAVIYAKYGLYEKALSILNNILLHEDYIPALINMGNIYFLLLQMKKARAYYERAYEKDPIHPVILLNLARVNFALENYGNVKESYRKLLSIDPDLALEFNYLELPDEEARVRAVEAEKIKKVIWIEK